MVGRTQSENAQQEVERWLAKNGAPTLISTYSAASSFWFHYVGVAIWWSMRRLIREFAHLGRRAARAAIPFVCINLAALLFTAELWQVSAWMSWPMITACVTLFSITGIAFSAVRIGEIVNKLEVPAARSELSGTPAERLAAWSRWKPGVHSLPALTRRQRGNLKLLFTVPLTSQAVIVAVINSIAVVIVSQSVINRMTLRMWTGRTVRIVHVRLGPWTLGLWEDAIKAALLLGGLCILYFLVYTVTDNVFKRDFLKPISVELERIIGVYSVYSLDRKIRGTQNHHGYRKAEPTAPTLNAKRRSPSLKEFDQWYLDRGLVTFASGRFRTSFGVFSTIGVTGFDLALSPSVFFGVHGIYFRLLGAILICVAYYGQDRAMKSAVPISNARPSSKRFAAGGFIAVLICAAVIIAIMTALSPSPYRVIAIEGGLALCLWLFPDTGVQYRAYVGWRMAISRAGGVHGPLPLTSVRFVPPWEV